MATSERFWGLPVPVSASPVTVNLRGKCLHVTQIALATPSKNPVALKVSTAALGKPQFTLATLGGANQQAVVDITFFEGDGKVTFFAVGHSKASLHLTGVMVSDGSTSSEAKVKVQGTAAMIADEDDSDDDDEDFDPEAAQNGHQDAEDDNSEDDDDEDDEDNEDDVDEDDEDDVEEDEDEDDEDDEDDSEDDEDDDDDDEEEEEEVVQKRPQKRKAESFSTPAAKKKSPSSSKTPFTEKKSGLKVRVVKQGTGDRIKGGSKVQIHYTGKLQSGKEFDSSKGGDPLSFRCGMKKVIKGFDEGVMGMKKGEIRELVIPPNLAYGTKGAGSVVPPNATLRFEIQRV